MQSFEYVLQLLLLGKRGSGHTKWKASCSEPQEYTSVRGRHSEKPEELRNMIHDFFNVETRIELFARGRASGDWDQWGERAALTDQGCTFLPASPLTNCVSVCPGLEVDGFFSSSNDCVSSTELHDNGRRTLAVQTDESAFDNLHRKKSKRPPAPVLASAVNISPAICIPTPQPLKLSPAILKVSKPKPPAVQPSRLQADPDAVWQALHSRAPPPGKRVTVHKEDCHCFLCTPKKVQIA